MTPLEKAVTRKSAVAIRDKGKLREIVVTLHPGGYIGFRLAGTRKEDVLSIGGAYHMAVRARVLQERADKKAKRNKAR